MIADIEQFLKFDVDAGFKTAVYLTRKNMLGDILHFIDMETSRITFKWKFYDPNRKHNQPNLTPNSPRTGQMQYLRL